jgi:hypothetical protein
LVFEPRDAELVTSIPSLVIIFIPGKCEKSAVWWRDTEGGALLDRLAGFEDREELDDGVNETLLKSQLGVAGKPLDEDAPEASVGLEVAETTGAGEDSASTW